MDDRTSTQTPLPKIPKGQLSLDRSDETLRVCLLHHGQTSIIASNTIAPNDPIGDEILLWAVNAASRAGYLVYGITRVTDDCYTLNGPTYTINRLVLTRDDATGYQLHDESRDPTAPVAIGQQPATQDVDHVVSIAARIARDAGYRPIGYWEQGTNRWIIAESPLPPYHWYPAEQPRAMAWRAFRQRLVVVLRAVLIFLSAFVATITHVWWVALTGAILALGLMMAPRWRRSHRYQWSCSVCWSRGQRTSIRAASQDALDEMRDAHTSACVRHPHWP